MGMRRWISLPACCSGAGAIGGLVAGLFGCLAGCSTTEPVSAPQIEDFRAGTTYSHSFAGTGSATCEAVRRALLSQGYLVSVAKPELVKASKNFQPTAATHIQVEFNVVCAPNSKNSMTTTAFANAVRDTYALKKSSTSASVGVGVLGSLSLPIGSTDDSLVKVASETIASKKFYAQFFEQVEAYLEDPVLERPAAMSPDGGHSLPPEPRGTTTTP